MILYYPTKFHSIPWITLELWAAGTPPSLPPYFLSSGTQANFFPSHFVLCTERDEHGVIFLEWNNVPFGPSFCISWKADFQSTIRKQNDGFGISKNEIVFSLLWEEVLMSSKPWMNVLLADRQRKKWVRSTAMPMFHYCFRCKTWTLETHAVIWAGIYHLLRVTFVSLSTC